MAKRHLRTAQAISQRRPKQTKHASRLLCCAGGPNTRARYGGGVPASPDPPHPGQGAYPALHNPRPQSEIYQEPAGSSMSLVNLANTCAHLQNVGRVKKPLTSIPLSKLHLQIALGLYKEGFLSSVQRGDLRGPDPEYTPTTFDNISTRRLWLGMKYRNFEPVLSKFRLVSHPNRRVFASHAELVGLCTGRPLGKVQALSLGEVMFVRAKNKEKSVHEIHDAVKRNLSGELLCRAS